MSNTEHIREKLSGLEVRQLLRDAARRQASILSRAYKFRRDGRFNSFDEAIKLVQEEFGWESNLEEYYGVRLLHLQCGMTLAYDQTGTLSWASAPRIKHDGSLQCEMEFIEGTDAFVRINDQPVEIVSDDSRPASPSASSKPA